MAPAVPLALAGLASGFGMGPGVSLPLWPPQHCGTLPCTRPGAGACGVVVTLAAPGGGCGGGFVNRIVDAFWCRARGAGSGCVLDAARSLACVCVFGVSPRPISTRPLSPLRGVHVGPIYPVVCGGPYPREGGGRPHLEAGFPLRCFQRLSLPDVANQPCPWRDNWHTRGPSIPVLSY